MICMCMKMCMHMCMCMCALCVCVDTTCSSAYIQTHRVECKQHGTQSTLSPNRGTLATNRSCACKNQIYIYIYIYAYIHIHTQELS